MLRTSRSARPVLRAPARRPRLRVNPLEDRTVPTVLNLTGGTTIGTLNGAVFQLMNQQPAGSGVIDSFVRIDSPGNGTTEQGHNTSGRNQGSPKLNFDENSSPTFTHNLQLQDVPRVHLTGQGSLNGWYREFRLDVNEPNNNSAVPVSMNKFKIFTSSTPSILASGTDISELGTLRFDMDGNVADSAGATSGADQDSAAPSLKGNWVALDDLNHGSGQADMRVLVPESAFNGVSNTAYVYLFSRFGDTKAMTGGYEEWYVGPAQNEVPVNVVTRIDQITPPPNSTVIQTGVTQVPLGAYVMDNAFVTVAGSTTPVTTGSVTFSFWVHPVGFQGDPCSGDPTYTFTDTNGADGWTTTIPDGALHAGVYAYNARFNGSGSYTAGTAECEPLNVGRATLSMDTNIHDASHNDITNTHVALGSVIHDKAFFNPAAPTSGEFVAAGSVSYTLYKDDGDGLYGAADPDGGDTVVKVSNKTLNADSTIPESDDSPGLHAGTYYYLTHYTSAANASGFNDYNDADGPVEVVTVDQAQLHIRTDIHNAAHEIITAPVAYHSNVHDTATVTGAVAGFPIPGITFYFGSSHATASPVATDPSADPPATARSVDSGPLANGSYTYYAVVDSSSDYIGATSDDEPLTVNPNLNRTQGFWKTHSTQSPGGQENAWPVDHITIGGVVYTEDEAVNIMNLSTNGNAISSLFQQLVAAKLNVLAGFSVMTAAEQAAADEADAAIAQATGGNKLEIVGANTLNYVVDPNSALGQIMVNDNNILDAFNSSSGL